MIRVRSTALLLAVAASACSNEPAGDPTPPDMMASESYPLSNAAALRDGAPSNDELPEEGKADQTLPSQFDLMDTQSPVRSQGSRGVCSIFATTALMEHLYMVEGTLPNPDFSEQYLQWATKASGQFANTEGSNSAINIATAASYGSVLESVWPYESEPWGPAEDPACVGGEGLPVQCYTNGEPPEEAASAQAFFIGEGRYINSSPRSIKSHMFNEGTAVEFGGEFFYQAWNHGATNLGRSPEYRRYARRGIILPPTHADIEDSSGARRAGHGFLAVGWDDEMEVQAIDDDGEMLFDDDGNPVMVRGFFLIKNSWGTGWGQDNIHGPGYGWIAYDYVENYIAAYASSVPEVTLTEVCGDGIDNDNDGDYDCLDSDCADDRVCGDPIENGFYGIETPIPDNDPEGVATEIELLTEGTVTGTTVNVAIRHTYVGDLTITLEHEGVVATLYERENSGQDDLVETFVSSDFDGLPAAGPWVLKVVDNAAVDAGHIEAWDIQVASCDGDACNVAPTLLEYQSTVGEWIDDYNEEMDGILDTLSVTEDVEIRGFRMGFAIDHPNFQDLTIAVNHGDQWEVLVHEYDAPGANHEYVASTDAFNGITSGGDWTIYVRDNVTGNIGYMHAWAIEITY